MEPYNLCLHCLLVLVALLYSLFFGSLSQYCEPLQMVQVGAILKLSVIEPLYQGGWLECLNGSPVRVLRRIQTNKTTRSSGEVSCLASIAINKERLYSFGIYNFLSLSCTWANSKASWLKVSSKYDNRLLWAAKTLSIWPLTGYLPCHSAIFVGEGDGTMCWSHVTRPSWSHISWGGSTSSWTLMTIKTFLFSLQPKTKFRTMLRFLF